MNINFNFVSHCVAYLVSESGLPSLTDQQQKILLIASVALGALATTYAIKRCCRSIAKIEGAIINGRLEGLGKIIFDSGVIIQGNFKNGKLNGQGQVLYPPSTPQQIVFYRIIKEEGTFKDGMLHGPGKTTDYTGKVREGIFDSNHLLSAKNVLL